jgi:hypothetical protein
MRASLLAALAVVACATGCRVAMVEESRERPEGARLEMWATCKHDDDSYWTEVTIENRGDAPVTIATDCFRLAGDDGKPMVFADWAYFGGSQFTLSRPRPLAPGKPTYGVVRWRPLSFPPTVRLEVTVGDERHAWVFREP